MVLIKCRTLTLYIIWISLVQELVLICTMLIFFFGLLLRSYIFYHLLINHALLLLCFLDVKAIPMEVAVTIKLRLETIVQVIKKQRVSHVNTLKKITLIVYKEILL